MATSEIIKRPLRPKHVVGAICQWFSLSEDELKCTKRTETFTLARHATVRLLREAGCSWQECVDALGRKDHTTAMHIMRRARGVDAALLDVLRCHARKRCEADKEAF